MAELRSFVVAHKLVELVVLHSFVVAVLNLVAGAAMVEPGVE